jgi:hypothetical protein
MQIKHWQLIASNLLPSDAAGPIFFEAHEISSDLEQVNLVGIINPSSSSMDGKGNLKAALLLFGSVEVRNLDSKMRLEARHVFFTDVNAEVFGGSAAAASMRRLRCRPRTPISFSQTSPLNSAF